MAFNSIHFLIFFSLVVIAYVACPARYRWAVLLAASYIFYAAWGLEYVFWLVASTLIVYILAIQMARTLGQTRRKALLVLGLGLNLGLLGLFKYLAFFSDSLRVLFGWLDLVYPVPAFQLLLPVGISFYTFQTSSYLIDVYRGKAEPERHLGILALFVSFFPQLVAGPIERAGDLIPQFHVRREWNASGLFRGLQLVLWGMFKKVVVADRLAVYVDAVYNNPADHRGLPVILATCFFAVQMYCDFSGYTDIAHGTAKVLGYNLSANFRRPYCASSISEFWRRWHISLSLWFRDYVYIPLGGSRVPKWRWYVNLMAVFLLSGLWHGASWTFVLWGGLHGLYYLLEVWTQKARDQLFERLHLSEPALRTAIGTVATLSLVCLAWVFFRANSISDAFLLLDHMGQLGVSTDLYVPWAAAADKAGLEMALALGLVVLVAAVHRHREQPGRAFLALWERDWVRWVVYLLLALAIMNLGMTREVPFVYLQF